MRAKGYALNSSSPTLLVGPCDQPVVGGRLNRDSLLNKSVEQLPAVSRRSTVEPKREFVEIGVQLPAGQRTLMGTQQPAFEQGGDRKSVV